MLLSEISAMRKVVYKNSKLDEISDLIRIFDNERRFKLLLVKNDQLCAV